MKQSNAIPWWAWVVWGFTIIMGFIAYFHLPAQVTTLFRSAGKAHRTSPRLLAVSYEPLIMLVVILLWHVLWRIDPKKRNYESFWSTYRYIGGVIVVGIGLVYLTVLGHVLHIASMRFIPTAVGIMFMLIANVSPRLEPNWFIGFRTPWTLSSKESWIRTHRLGGQLGVPMGILIIILGWVLPTNLSMKVAIVVPILLWALITVVASYFYARQTRH